MVVISTQKTAVLRLILKSIKCSYLIVYSANMKNSTQYNEKKQDLFCFCRFALYLVSNTEQNHEFLKELWVLNHIVEHCLCQQAHILCIGRNTKSPVKQRGLFYHLRSLYKSAQQ